MKTIKIADATPLQIDYLVAKVEGFDLYYSKGGAMDSGKFDGPTYRPTRKPAQGHPILEREGIAIRKHSTSRQWFAMLSTDLGDSEGANWYKTKRGERYGPMSYEVHRIQCRFAGPTMLIAGLRCFLASRLGETAEVPEEI